MSRVISSGPELRVARHHRQFLDVDRRIAVVADHALADQDRVFVVVAVPRHERDEHVLPERQLAHVGGGAVGDDVALRDHVADDHQRPLVDVGVLVRPLVLGEVVDVDADFAGRRLGVMHANDDARGVDVVDLAAPARHDGGARVDGGRTLHAGPDERLLRTQARHRLPLHVRAHQRAVRVVMLEERDQRCRHRHDLRRRDVHVVDLFRGRQHELVLAAAGDELIREPAVAVDLRVRLRDHVLAFFDRRQEIDLVGDLAVHHAPVRRLEEAVFIRARIQRERIDEADVRAFRRFDRAHAAVVRRMHVAHFEARALARQAARPQRGNAALVRDLRQRVRLVHELRQLRAAEELLDRGRDRLGVDQVVRQQVVALGLAEALLDRALDADEARAELVFRQFADRAHATIAEVIDVVDLAAPVAQVHEDLDDGDDVLVGQRRRALQFRAADAPVELHAADGRQVVPLFREEEAMEQRLDRFLGRRFARPHHPVDRDLGRVLVRRIVAAQRLRDERTLVEIVGVDRLDALDARVEQLLQQLVGDFVVRLGDHFTGRGIDDVGRERTAHDVLVGHGNALDAAVHELAHVAGGDPLVLGGHDLAVLAQDVEARHLAAQALRHEVELRALGAEVERVELEELLEDVLVGEADRLQQRRHRHLAAAVDAEEQEVLRIEFEVEPRAAIGNHAGREQELAGRMRLAAVVLEEHARRAMELGDDDALGAVDDERAVLGHERNLAHVDLLLLHFLDGVLRRFLVHDDQADLGAQRGAVRQAALLAFDDVEGRRQQRKAHELEAGVARVARDREDRRERGLQAFVLALVSRA